MLVRAYTLALLLLASRSMAQVEDVLPRGKFSVGYSLLTIPYFNPGNGDSVRLVLNLWYPTSQASGSYMRLLEYLHCHKRDEAKEVYASFVEQELQLFKRFTTRNFGHFAEEDWQQLEQRTTYAIRDAPYASTPFPLILGRLRAFSTTLTNEFLASHGYVVCMLNGVENYPPDDRVRYHKQVINEIEYFEYIRQYVHQKLGISTSRTGLMGFSGGGFSQFFTPMHYPHYFSLALLESGIFLDGDLFDIVSHHPYYQPKKFKTPLLFLYNEQRFDSHKSSQNFFTLKTHDKYLVLFNDSTQHHWDFATEGMVSALYLRNRDKKVAIRAIDNFRKMNILLVEFFDCYLKNEYDFNLKKNKRVVIY